MYHIYYMYIIFYNIYYILYYILLKNNMDSEFWGFVFSGHWWLWH